MFKKIGYVVKTWSEIHVLEKELAKGKKNLVGCGEAAVKKFVETTEANIAMMKQSLRANVKAMF